MGEVSPGSGAASSPMRMADLFGLQRISGLRYAEDLIGSDAEEGLITDLLAADLERFRFHGWVGNRRTKSFGWRYDFDDASFSRTGPIPKWLLGLREQAAAFAGMKPADFIHVLLARYDPGAGIGWHRDRDVFEDVVGISLGTPATLRFRRRTSEGFQRVNLELRPRSAYLLSGESRWAWEHSIVAGDLLRFSITFRTLSEKGRRVAAREEAL